MTAAWKVIQKLESDNSRLFKEKVIADEMSAGNDEFFEGCRLALDSTITFGIKKVPEKTSANGAGIDWESFTLAITGFITREVTGNAARDMIEEMIKNATCDQWNSWYRRILIKDLRCGVSEKTINSVVKKIRPEYCVPVFECQLAHDSANHETKLSGSKLIQVKLDGVRVITIVYPEGRVDQFSRNGKELVNFEHIKKQFASVAHYFSEPMVFDGEVMSSSFQDLMRQVHRKENVRADDANLFLFDCLTLEKFQAGGNTVPQKTRTNTLEKLFQDLFTECPNILHLASEYVDLDTDAGQKRFSEINKSALEHGYEGLMIKEPTAGYQCKRTTDWLKLKPFIEVSLEIKNVEEGTGRNQGRLGALVLEGVDDGKAIGVNCGSGFSDADRDQLWANRNNIVGQVVEIRADAVTQNQDGSYSLRFPRFVRFRGFKAGEKI